METPLLLVGIWLVALGGFMAARADLMMRFQIWINRAVMGAEYIPSPRTYTALRILGAFLLVIGLLLITRFFK